MAVTDSQVEHFLVRYADTLARFDAPAAAELWSTPGMIVDDRFSGVLDSRPAMVAGLEQSYPLYRRLGLAAVDHQLLVVEHLSAGLVMVTVRWVFLDALGQQLTDSTPRYLLRLDGDQLRVCVCVQTDDLEKLTALAEQQGVDLSEGTTQER